jgi:hypothetical protein
MFFSAAERDKAMSLASDGFDLRPRGFDAQIGTG